MKVTALTNTAVETNDTPLAFGVGFFNGTAGDLVVEGSDTSASSGYTDLVTVPATGMASVNGRLPRWIRVKTAATVYTMQNQ